ncbi:MAG TPA: 3-phosphoshikimate 1-carboxyvinyltransferase, partial [Methanocorpusculum sp.]|nr:3-phosphoshikimate 1-carboxyvinyltransferase [Methanocorpusculum sp.]
YTLSRQRIAPAAVRIEGDWSSAAYLLAAGALAGSVTVTGLSQNTVQGDKNIIRILEEMGADISCSETAVTVSSRPLHAIDCDLNGTPDLVPVVAVLAAHAHGISRISGVAHLAYKESDRLQGIFDLLSSFGISVMRYPDGFGITGGRMQGSRIPAANDHRMFMAAVIAGLASSSPTEIAESPNAAMISYPAFLPDIRALGGICRT